MVVSAAGRRPGFNGEPLVVSLRLVVCPECRAVLGLDNKVCLRYTGRICRTGALMTGSRTDEGHKRP